MEKLEEAKTNDGKPSYFKFDPEMEDEDTIETDYVWLIFFEKGRYDIVGDYEPVPTDPKGKPIFHGAKVYQIEKDGNNGYNIMDDE